MLEAYYVDYLCSDHFVIEMELLKLKGIIRELKYLLVISCDNPVFENIYYKKCR